MELKVAYGHLVATLFAAPWLRTSQQAAGRQLESLEPGMDLGLLKMDPAP